MVPHIEIVNDSICWNPLPYQLQAVSFLAIVGIATDKSISEAALNEPDAKPWFLLECLDIHDETLYIISDNTEWHPARRKYDSNRARYVIINQGPPLTTNDQDIINKLIRQMCMNII